MGKWQRKKGVVGLEPYQKQASKHGCFGPPKRNTCHFEIDFYFKF